MFERPDWSDEEILNALKNLPNCKCDDCTFYREPRTDEIVLEDYAK